MSANTQSRRNSALGNQRFGVENLSETGESFSTKRLLRKKNEEVDATNYLRNPYQLGALKRMLINTNDKENKAKSYEMNKVPLVNRSEAGLKMKANYKNACDEIQNGKLNSKKKQFEFNNSKGMFFKKPSKKKNDSFGGDTKDSFFTTFKTKTSMATQDPEVNFNKSRYKQFQERYNEYVDSGNPETHGNQKTLERKQSFIRSIQNTYARHVIRDQYKYVSYANDYNYAYVCSQIDTNRYENNPEEQIPNRKPKANTYNISKTANPSPAHSRPPAQQTSSTIQKSPDKKSVMVTREDYVRKAKPNTADKIFLKRARKTSEDYTKYNDTRVRSKAGEKLNFMVTNNSKYTQCDLISTIIKERKKL